MTLYIGVDFHPHQQTVCWLDRHSQKKKVQTFAHNSEALEKFYQHQPPSVVGIEATSKATWFAQMLFDNHHQLVIGNPTIIRKKALSRHKNDKRDARHIYQLLASGDFPELWQRPKNSTSILELLKLRHKLVGQRTQTANRLQVLAHEAGLPKGKISSSCFQGLINQIELEPPQEFQRNLLFDLWHKLNGQILELDKVLAKIAADDKEVCLVRTQKGVGRLTALCLVHTIGEIARFDRVSKQVVAFVGLDPVEDSSSEKVRFGSISKTGSKLLRFLLGQAALSVTRYDAKLKGKYRSLKKKKHWAVAKTAIARRLLVKLAIMLRDEITAEEFDERGRTAGNARGARVRKSCQS